jgi:hypothetical protein
MVCCFDPIDIFILSNGPHPNLRAPKMAPMGTKSSKRRRRRSIYLIRKWLLWAQRAAGGAFISSENVLQPEIPLKSRGL